MTTPTYSRPKKSLGQNFLTDMGVLARIVAAVRISPDDKVLEIGPGRGALTRLLAPKSDALVAVEADYRLAATLSEEFAGDGKVEIVQGDILSVDLPGLLIPRWDGRWKVAANLPYNISSQVIFMFLDNCDLFSELVLMLQKEVGDRLTAKPGTKEYGVLTPLCALHFNINREFIVRPGSFYPVPKVDSVVLKFSALPSPRTDVGDELFFRRVVKAAFSQRRKTLWNCLKSVDLGVDEAGLVQAFNEALILPSRRGETLSLEEFAMLSRTLIAMQK